MPRICVHAGFHKTATTSFQAFCTQNRAALRRHGLHYARLDYQQVLDRPNHSFVFRSAYDAAAAGDNRLRQSLVRELGRQLQGCDSMLISGEVISVLSDPAKALLLQDLRLLADELRFFLLVRHPKSYFQSALQEHLRVWAGINVFSLPENMLAGLVDHGWGSLYTGRLGLFLAPIVPWGGEDAEGPLDIGRLDASVYPAVQNFCLAARALGLGTALTTVIRIRTDEVFEALGVPARSDGRRRFEIAALVPLGHPAGSFGVAPRKPASTVTHWNGWGNRRG